MRAEKGTSAGLDSMLALIDANGRIVPIQTLDSAVPPQNGGTFMATDPCPSKEVTLVAEALGTTML